MALNLSIKIDDNSGFCFGVVEAINKAENKLDDGFELYCLGDIVHNDEEINRLRKKGLIPIDKEVFNNLENKAVLFRAHGEPPETYEVAKKNNIEVIDASCPIIKKLQEKIKQSYDNNECILIYGKPHHPEIIALNGQLDNNGIIVENTESIDLQHLPRIVTLYSQTTQPLDGFYELIKFLKKNGKNVKVKDTICRSVSNRRLQLKKFCEEYDKIIFVADKRSSNGKMLHDVCKRVNPDIYFISNTKDIKHHWFKPGEKAGITGATSTPRWLMEEVKNYLEKI